MVEKRLSHFGIGPVIAVPSLAYTIAALFAGSRWPGTFILDWVPQIIRGIGGILMIVGLALWLAAIPTVMRAYNRDQLVTSGAYALVRHPMYAGWIALAFPGFALVMRSWPMLVTPLIAYAIFKRMIYREDKYLEQRFGQPYLEYRQCMNEVVPVPRFWRKRVRTKAAGAGR